MYTGTHMQACSIAEQKEKQQLLNTKLLVSGATYRELGGCSPGSG